MTPAEDAVLAAARAYRDACDARAKASALASSLVVVGSRSASFLSASDAADAAGHVANDAEEALLSSALAMGLVDAPPVEAPTVATVRPWPDPEAYKALAREVFGIKPLDPSKSLPPGTNLSALFGVDIAGVLE